jgi:callose synthase
MTPYYSEETVFSKNDLDMENEDGVSIIFYLQKIFPGTQKKYFNLSLFRG